MNKKAIPPTMDEIIRALQSKLLEYPNVKNDSVEPLPVVRAVPQVSVTPSSVSSSSSPIGEEKQSLIKKEGVNKKAPIGEALKRLGVHAKLVKIPALVAEKANKKRPGCVIS